MQLLCSVSVIFNSIREHLFQSLTLVVSKYPNGGIVVIDDFNRLDNTAAKLLGLTISDDLTWNAHVNEVVKKASKKLYFLVQLKRSRLPPSDLVRLYLSCVRSTVGYAIPVF